MSKSLTGALWMWMIGSLMSQVVICFMAPHDYQNYWYGYLFMTLLYSAIGVFTLGLASLIFVQHWPKSAELMKTWKGIPIGIVAGWLATVLMIVIGCLITGEMNWIVEESPLWLMAALFGSLYGLIGGCFLLLKKGEKEPERTCEI